MGFTNNRKRKQNSSPSPRQPNAMTSARKAARTTKKPENKKRRGNRLLSYILLTILILGTLITLSLTVFFKIEEVRVIGNDFYSDGDIISATELELQTNLFLAKTSDIPDKIATTFPYIETVQVKRVLPPAIEIHVTQSTVAATIELGEDEFAIISDTGKVLERGLVLIPAEVILVKGFSMSDKAPGEHLGQYTPVPISDDATDEAKELVQVQNQELEDQANRETDSLKIIKDLNEAVIETGFTSISNLDISDPYAMTVMYENRFLLKLGTELRLEYKLKFLKKAIEELDISNPEAWGTISAENALQDNEAIAQLDEEYILWLENTKLPQGQEDLPEEKNPASDDVSTESSQSSVDNSFSSESSGDSPSVDLEIDQT